ncbi:uncharacterized protein BJX67DRAFT_340874 [Aspergillus lucknowensis]|uniref:Uncharacterized protein n=1 Tax=Aspergillus lucknowensis TaxID=176173 RepID=A0ABR4M5K1_9EURO
MGSFDGSANWRFESGPPPFWGWQHRPGRWFSYYDGPSQRPFKSAPPPLPHEPAGPESFYPLPFLMDRALGSQFRHGYPDYDNRLFLDEYRFPGPHQIYQPPHLEGENHVPSENVCESEDKPEAQSKKLRGEAPEFVPRSRFAAEEEPKAKVKEPCWLVVSSQ